MSDLVSGFGQTGDMVAGLDPFAYSRVENAGLLDRLIREREFGPKVLDCVE